MSNVRGRPELSGHYISKRLRLADAARRVAAFALLLLVASVLFFRLGAIEGAALVALLTLVAGLAVLAGLVAIGGLVRVWKHGAEGGGKAVGALGLALLVLAPFAVMGLLALEYPGTNRAITDGMTTTDFDTLATLEEGAAGGTSEDTLSGRRYQAAAAQVFLAARMVIEDQGLEVVDIVAGDPSAPAEEEVAPGDLGVSGTVAAPFPTPRASVDINTEADPLDVPDADQYSIVATARDFLLALPSDVEIRIVEDEGSSFVDMRSASREVPYDLGQNRRFIEGFLLDLDDAMAGVENIPAG